MPSTKVRLQFKGSRSPPDAGDHATDIILQEVTFEDFYVTLLNVERAILRGS